MHANSVDATRREARSGKQAILTSIDEPVVVLLISLGAIPLSLEMHCRNSLGSAGTVVMKGYFTEWANC
jgi:hypothetical protein